jgi:hypothetical protein
MPPFLEPTYRFYSSSKKIQIQKTFCSPIPVSSSQQLPSDPKWGLVFLGESFTQGMKRGPSTGLSKEEKTGSGNRWFLEEIE